MVVCEPFSDRLDLPDISRYIMSDQLIYTFMCVCVWVCAMLCWIKYIFETINWNQNIFKSQHSILYADIFVCFVLVFWLFFFFFIQLIGIIRSTVTVTITITTTSESETMEFTLYKYDPNSEVQAADLEIVPESAMLGFPGAEMIITGK